MVIFYSYVKLPEGQHFDVSIGNGGDPPDSVDKSSDQLTIRPSHQCIIPVSITPKQEKGFGPHFPHPNCHKFGITIPLSNIKIANLDPELPTPLLAGSLR